ncbi:MAG: protein kinase [Gemmatimonadetes bacterium]|nr:protein kinase [Gemmatimonadota bacterium]
MNSPDPIIRLNAALSGRYAVERELGQGGMAAVYLARDLKHDRKVALKVLRPELAAVLGADRFLAEIRATANLRHAHIVPLFDSGEADGDLYYVMPHVEGGSLRGRFTRTSPLEPSEAVRIARAVANALDHAHRLGILHRDIKPENILIQDGDPVVADFGIAVATGAVMDERLTATGLSPGTPRYMSPEQVGGERDLTPATDVYSLACVLYEMVIGEPPHGDRFGGALLAARASESPEELPGLQGGLSAELTRALRKALSLDPGDRFATAGAFADALEAVAASPNKNRSAIPLAAATVAAIAVAGLALWTVRGDPGVTAAEVAELELLEDERDFRAAFDRAEQLRERSPDDPTLDEMWEALSYEADLISDPAGAEVSWRSYSDATWRTAGRTPLTVRVPRGATVFELSLPGFRSAEIVATGRLRPEPVQLLPADAEAHDVTWAPGFTTEEGLELGPYLLDRYEVSNRDFAEFVQAGGYESRAYWPDSLEIGGSLVPWEESRGHFVDQTGRAGPLNWEVGDYPEGEGDLPVVGVSWYEAMAYAAFRGRQLPSVHHWANAAPAPYGQWMLPASNLDVGGLLPTGEPRGIGRHGNSDLVGNVREWMYNDGPGGRHIRGGAASDNVMHWRSEIMSRPDERAPATGLRLATYLDSLNLDRARAPVVPVLRTYEGVEPVSDEVFAGYRRLYEYDDRPLEASEVQVDTTDHWIRERVSFTAGYGPLDDRMVAYVYRPVEGPTRLDPMILWPGGSAYGPASIEEFLGGGPDCRSFFCRLLRMLVRSDRAIVFPVYHGLFERFEPDVRAGSGPNRLMTIGYRDDTIRRIQDVSRTIDYLETRDDLDHTRLSYFGFSWGGWMSSLALAMEPRLQVGVAVIGGLSALPVHPEMDPINFASRVTQPVLMFNTRQDPQFPADRVGRPMFDLLPGDSGVYKEFIVEDGGHNFRSPAIVGYTIDWLERHLGEPER